MESGSATFWLNSKLCKKSENSGFQHLKETFSAYTPSLEVSVDQGEVTCFNIAMKEDVLMTADFTNQVLK